jgi:uncharacterized repeat protein (TIGR03843 family)
MTPDAAPEPAAVDADRVLELLRAGEIDIEGRLVDASNATLYCAISDPAMTAACVYKPIRGERPLWDFPDGTLAYREVAAYRVSEATGWSIVPPTVLRDGPVGPGMVQLWIDVDESVDLAALVRARQPALRRMALFDAVVNNADRKGGHLLPLPDGHVYGVDHGVCFSVEPKLRTVLWGWRGERLDDDELFVLSDLRAQLAGPLCTDLQALLAPDEVEATTARVDALLAAGCFPFPSPGLAGHPLASVLAVRVARRGLGWAACSPGTPPRRHRSPAPPSRSASGTPRPASCGRSRPARRRRCTSAGSRRTTRPTSVTPRPT